MNALLQIVGLCKRYGAIVVADEIELTMGDAGCLGLIGPNGAGKTSLFNLLTGVIRPDRGSIMFAGTDITSVPAHKRPRLGIVRAFQIPQCFQALSVYDNVKLAAHYGAGLSGSDADRLACETLVRTGLSSRADDLAGQLRLLDRKRLELAKALASQARLLLLDEIAGGLTDAETEKLVSLIGELKRDHAIIWIEHIPHALKAVADTVVVLHFGRKILEGEAHDVMASQLVHEIYMGIAVDAA